LKSLTGQLGSKAHQAKGLCLKGRLHVKRGEGAPARAAFGEAMTLFKELRNELDLGKVCFYYAQGLAELGEAREAQWYRVQAKEIFARLGAKGWLRRMSEQRDL